VFGLYCRYPYSLSWIWWGRGCAVPGSRLPDVVWGWVCWVSLVGRSVGGCWVLGCWLLLIEVVVEVVVVVEVPFLFPVRSFTYLPTYLPACLR
jgi:hypothetical protein